MKVMRLCPAKINLFLEVTGRRPNGYHELTTLFAKINLTDTLTLEVSPAQDTQISLQVTGPRGTFIPNNENNLVCKAARTFLQETHLNAHIQLALNKHIPTGAGLGGGSSDAAGVLLALCDVFHKNPMEFLHIAAKLGADVPLFMYPDMFLKGEGIGEQLTPIPAGKPLPYLVLVYPNTAVPTAGVFARLKLPGAQEILTTQTKFDKLLGVVRNGSPFTQWKPLLFNRLEEFVLPFVPAVANAFQEVANANEGICRMSGSGSTVFTLVGTKQHAQELVTKLQHPGLSVFSTTFYEEIGHAGNGNKNSFNE